MTKEKLIKQYQERIEDCDVLLKSTKEQVRILRHKEMNAEEKVQQWDMLSSDRKVQSAQRQCYVQFISDLEYELED